MKSMADRHGDGAEEVGEEDGGALEHADQERGCGPAYVDGPDRPAPELADPRARSRCTGEIRHAPRAGPAAPITSHLRRATSAVTKVVSGPRRADPLGQSAAPRRASRELPTRTR